jgi:dephospho-CoA kinase
MLIIGLTGGIGSGKSTAANLFQQLGVPIIDSDEIAREVVAPGAPLLTEIAQHFGSNIIDETGQLKRRELRDLIFANDQERIWLEQHLHPAIYERIKEKIKSLNAPYVIVVIPLLIETNPGDLIDRTLVVDSPEQLQIQRVQKRDAATKENILAIIQSQITRDKRLAAADDVINNNSDLHNLEQQVNKLHQIYLKITE